MLLEIKNLEATSNGKKEILKGINFQIKKGEIQALLGPNASGKSTFAQVISGNPKYEIKKGEIFLNGKNITKLPPEERTKLGVCLSWQSAPAIKGVKLYQLLDRISKEELQKSNLKELGIKDSFLLRDTNLNFSGGEKRISELLQILSLKPKLVIFDEIDSGLDLKKIRIFSDIIKKELIDKKISILLITHSGEILNFLKPAITNVMVSGKIICREKNFKKVLATIKKYGYEKCKKCGLLAN